MRTNQFAFRPRLSSAKQKTIKLRYEELLAARTKRIGQLLKPINQLSRQSKKEFSTLVSKSEWKTIKSLIDNTRIAIAKVFLSKNASGIQLKKNGIKREFKKSWQKVFEQFPAIQKLRDKHRGQVEDAFFLIESKYSVLDNLIAHIPDILSLPELEFVSFKPPYEFSEVFGTGFESPVSRDDSFADIQTGLVINDFDFSYEGGGSFNPVTIFDSYAGMGMSYTMPTTGVLKVTAIMQNTLSLFQASITDDFGFSEGNVRMSACIYMNVLHPNNLEMSEKFSLSFLSLSSGGDDVSKTQSDLQKIQPYTITLLSTGAFAQGETLQFIVGSHVHIRSYVDDMTSHLKARIGWQVKEVFVEVI